MSELLPSINQLIDDFQRNKGWDKQYRLLIQLGKKLPAISEQHKTDKNQVKGCESIAWLVVEKKNDFFHFYMDSDTRVVRGLMMILTIIYEGKKTEQIMAIDINDLFMQLGLLNHLSPSRANGLLAIVDKIKQRTANDKD